MSNLSTGRVLSFASASSNSSEASGSLFPRSLLPGELCGFAPVLERFLMIAAKYFGSFGVHDVSLQVPSVFHCPCSDSVKYFDHDQLLQYLIQTIQLLGPSFCDDVVAMDCS